MKKNFLLSFLLFVIAFCASAQKNYRDVVNDYGKAFPYEKIYLHTDKPYYFPSDTIWFKAYVATPNEDLTYSMSPSVPLYVELVKPSVNPIASRMIIKLKQGKGRGDIIIPRELKPGIYKLRAYTSHALNFGEQAIFEKDVFISDIGKFGFPKAQENDFNLTFHPEGGAAIAGHHNRFAIRSLYSNGKGLPVTGYLLDSMRDTLTHFSTNTDGLGILEFSPEPYEKYEIHVFNQARNNKRFYLSDIPLTGFALNVDPFFSEEQIQIKVIRSGMSENIDTKLLVVHSGFIQQELGLNFENNIALLQLAKQDLIEGLYVFRLVQNGQEPIAERLIFISERDKIQVEYSLSEAAYYPKDKVDLQVRLMDDKGNPIKGEFSISVTDKKQVLTSEKPTNIKTYLNISSELKEKNSIKNLALLHEEKAMDIFLMTQTWRNFLPELEILAREKAPLDFETGLNISGEIIDKTWDGARDLRLLLINKEGYPEIHEGHTDEDGKFIFLKMDFMDSVGVYLQSFELKSRGKRDPKEIKSGTIHIHQLEIPDIRPPEKLEEIIWMDVLEDDPYLQQVKNINEIMRKSFLMNELELDEFVVKGRRAYRQDPRTIAYNDNPNIRLRIPEEAYNYYNIFEFFRARASRRGLSFTPNSNYFIDGNFTTYQMVVNMRVSEIEYMDILSGMPPNQMNIGGRTAFNILTKKGNPDFDWTSVRVDGTKGFKIQGYAPVREFHIPSEKQDLNSPIALDFRSTIYWNPLMITDEKGNAKVSFPLSEGVTIVNINLQGISDDGIPFYGSMEFEVKEKD